MVGEMLHLDVSTTAMLRNETGWFYVHQNVDQWKKIGRFLLQSTGQRHAIPDDPKICQANLHIFKVPGSPLHLFLQWSSDPFHQNTHHLLFQMSLPWVTRRPGTRDLKVFRERPKGDVPVWFRSQSAGGAPWNKATTNQNHQNYSPKAPRWPLEVASIQVTSSFREWAAKCLSTAFWWPLLCAASGVYGPDSAPGLWQCLAVENTPHDTHMIRW